MTLIDLGLIGLIALVGQPVADLLHANPQIGDLAAWLAVAILADRAYALIVTTLQARRSMTMVAVLGVVNQLVLSVALVSAALIDPRPEALTVARLVYSFATLALAVGVYVASRERGDFVLPSIGSILRSMPTVSGRRYWRYGFANAVDKNLADLFIQVPVQIVGVLGGERAVGYVTLAMTGIQNTGILTSAIFENLKAVVPQAIGRRDYAVLWVGIRRALLSLTVAATALYALLAITAPLVIPTLLGDEWIPAIPALVVLALFGAINAVAGIFGPLYRALFLMRAAIVAKVAALVLVLLPGAALLALIVGQAGTPDGANAEAVAQTAAVGGALLIDGLFAVQAVLTARSVLPALRRLATKATEDSAATPLSAS
ncbi:MAG: oligosaccharide flippase family protein [Chloroflexi bacterium]|nr:oligosaccharide flippase family protein [Chloroflexota bacterium]